MKDISKFSTVNRNLKVEINKEVEKEIFNYCISVGDKEIGGILIGNYNDKLDTAKIFKVTGPPKDSKLGSNWFVRGIVGLKKMLKSLWSQNMYYLGEWHYHPLGSPYPSPQDDVQMKKIVSTDKMHCPEAILLIVGGGPVHGFRYKIFVYTKNKKFVLVENSL